MKFANMKFAKWMLALMAVLPGLAVAQSQSAGKIVAQVPFEFVVANRVVPAGQYSVQSAALDRYALLITNTSANVSLFTARLADEGNSAPENSLLVFKTYGNQHFLWEIRMQDSRVVYRLPESKAEAELRAQSKPATEETLLAHLSK